MPSPDLWATAAAGGFGAAVVAIQNFFITRSEHRRGDRAELRDAYAGYLQALDAIASELSALPAAKPTPRLDRIASRIGFEKEGHLLAAGLQRLLVGERWAKLGDQYNAAYARLFLVAPADFLSLAGDVTRHLGRGQRGTTPEWRTEYLALRERVGTSVATIRGSDRRVRRWRPGARAGHAVSAAALPEKTKDLP